MSNELKPCPDPKCDSDPQWTGSIDSETNEERVWCYECKNIEVPHSVWQRFPRQPEVIEEPEAGKERDEGAYWIEYQSGRLALNKHDGHGWVDGWVELNDVRRLIKIPEPNFPEEQADDTD